MVLGCIVMKYGKVVANTFRQLKVHKRNYPTHVLELAVLVFSLKIERYYRGGVMLMYILTIRVFDMCLLKRS